MIQDDIWAMEEAFWLRGPDFYRLHLAPTAVMVFPDTMGILMGEAIISTLEGASRWDQVTLQNKHVIESDHCLTLVYDALASRKGAQGYRATCSSTYARGEGGWKLLCHHQSVRAAD
ncbi:DUF4440 domain-containing protein [Ketogulonicigenium vulgare]|uniref:DUF4440 domain-containing protein n=1 Tax=Ketogulonicigenium vulgare TaxID=92945 RepID=UPI002358EA4B|nr:nuclear transport factor 2 family protein [Ketogulonicigenium vulgare]